MLQRENTCNDERCEMLREKNREKLQKDEKLKVRKIETKMKEHELRVEQLNEFKDKGMKMTLNDKIANERL